MESAEQSRSPLVGSKPIDELPAGYRQGVLAVETIVFGFSLSFMKFWTFDTSGNWSLQGIAAILLLALSILLQIHVMWRSLDPADSRLVEYGKTRQRLMLAMAVLFLAVVFSVIVDSGWLGSTPVH